MNSKMAYDTAPVPLERVLVAAEGGAGLIPLTRFALRFAAPHALTRLIDVICNPAALVPTLLLSYPDWSEAHRAMLHAAQTRLDQAAHEAAEFVARPETELIDLAAMHRHATDALSDAARKWHTDLIAVASHPRGHRWACRLDPEELVAVSHCPVLHVPTACLGDMDAAVARVLVAVDGSDASMEALRLASRIVPSGATFRVIYVADSHSGLRALLPRGFFDHDGTRALAGAEALMKRASLPVETAVAETDLEYDAVASVILREARQWQADLVVMASSSRPKLMHPLPGHVVGHTLRDAQCPVLVCPPPARHATRVESARNSEQPVTSEGDVSPPPVFL
ncbi:Universal stress protein UspA [Paraburkholderia caribensis MBA4]|uniref:Universal stress protein UspA n=1 Tax=Paraburkholderia caribensis MBA4 TaxID=1323664 RepID=A0A0P0RA55_9BURK|nr:universal stress protein [Paraburkholderia caribensis]ALL65271.1 Universal stress protein UspA [Paraburkholderia caribensis MBA4]